MSEKLWSNNDSNQKPGTFIRKEIKVLDKEKKKLIEKFARIRQRSQKKVGTTSYCHIYGNTRIPTKKVAAPKASISGLENKGSIKQVLVTNNKLNTSANSDNEKSSEIPPIRTEPKSTSIKKDSPIEPSL